MDSLLAYCSHTYMVMASYRRETFRSNIMRCLFNRKLYMAGQLARLQTASQSYDINYTQLYQCMVDIRYSHEHDTSCKGHSRHIHG